MFDRRETFWRRGYTRAACSPRLFHADLYYANAAFTEGVRFIELKELGP